MSTMTDEKEEVENPDPYFEPLVNLPPVETKTLEEEEEELVKLRAKLFRYESAVEPPEWKERGTGDVKILKHKQTDICRILMRRDKTLKICANHYVLPHMELKPNCGSERAWVWSTPADFADEERKPELLAIRFANVENAQKFKTAFDKAKDVMEAKMERELQKAKNGVKETEEEKDKKTADSANKEDPKDTDNLTEKIGSLDIKEKSTPNDGNQSDGDKNTDSSTKAESTATVQGEAKEG